LAATRFSAELKALYAAMVVSVQQWNEKYPFSGIVKGRSSCNIPELIANDFSRDKGCNFAVVWYIVIAVGDVACYGW
jgi:hypothetical protein